MDQSNALKSIASSDEMRVGNYLVLFGGSDLTGEFFTKNTNFQSNYTDLGVLYVDFEHGQDPDDTGNTKHNVLGIVDWKSKIVDDKGVYVERILNRQAKYIGFIKDLIDAGVLGSSSEAVTGMTRKKSTGEITEWPLMRDSITATPMEPRMLTENVITAARALSAVFPDSKALALMAGHNRIDEIEDFKSAERFLRDACKLSRAEATAFLARAKGLIQRDSDSGDEMKALRDAITKRGAAFA